MIQHLYIHVPFCAVKCRYCAFYSEGGNARQMGDYVDATLTEFEPWADRLSPQTIFIGGGTPSLLPLRHLERLLAGLHFQTQPSNHPTIHPLTPPEFTIECNPATVAADKARLFRDHGVNRISLGVQALDAELLDMIGRIHTREAAIQSYDKLRQAGFDNINLDLMFGLPGQTIDHFRRTLTETVALQPDHISTYCLILEEDTEFWSLFKQGLLVPNEDQELAMYELAIETLSNAGYQQYEISNFARPGRECRHNIAYWEGKDYVGLGPSACSTVGNQRWQNIADTGQYIEALTTPKQRAGTSRSTPPKVARDVPARQVARDVPARQIPPRCSEETLTPALRAAEQAAFGMRMNAAVPAELVRDRWPGQIAELLSADLVQWRDGRLQPTRRGILFADQVASEFV